MTWEQGLELKKCLDEKSIHMALREYYGSHDSLPLKTPDAMAVIAVRGSRNAVRILVCVEHGGKSSIRDIKQAMEALDYANHLLGPVNLRVVVMHVHGGTARSAAKIPSTSVRHKRLVLVTGCCNYTRTSLTVLVKALKPLLD